MENSVLCLFGGFMNKLILYFLKVVVSINRQLYYSSLCHVHYFYTYIKCNHFVE